MATLSFTAKPKRQKYKLNFNKKNINNALLAFLAVAISAVCCALIAVKNISFLSDINKPAFFINPVIYAIISIAVYVVALPSLYLSYTYESNIRMVKYLSCFSLALNIVCFIFFFIVHSIGLSVLAIVSNLVVCCYYFKQIKQRALGSYLFIPYMVWIMFNVVLIYCIYLLN